jgi:hypothetical protein
MESFFLRLEGFSTKLSVQLLSEHFSSSFLKLKLQENVGRGPAATKERPEEIRRKGLKPAQ